jgi:hypothetical protein
MALANLIQADQQARIRESTMRAAFDAVVAHFSKKLDYVPQLLKASRTKALLEREPLVEILSYTNTTEPSASSIPEFVRLKYTLTAADLGDYINAKRITHLLEFTIVDELDRAVAALVASIPAGFVAVIEIVSSPVVQTITTDPLYPANSKVNLRWEFRLQLVRPGILKTLTKWTPEIPSPTS